METKKNNGFLIGIIVVLLLVVGGLVSYILFGGNGKEEEKVAANNTTPPVVQEEIKEEVKEEKVKGECPLAKFDSSYTLTEEDRNELIQILTSKNYQFDKDSLKVTNISETGYYIYVSFDAIPKTSDTFGFVARVNGKLKFISAIGSGTTDYHTMALDDALERMCS